MNRIFEQKTLDLRFEVYRAKPEMSGIGFQQDLKMTPYFIVYGF
jgi:hypothetical protein